MSEGEHRAFTNPDSNSVTSTHVWSPRFAVQFTSPTIGEPAQVDPRSTPQGRSRRAQQGIEATGDQASFTSRVLMLDTASLLATCGGITGLRHVIEMSYSGFAESDTAEPTAGQFNGSDFAEASVDVASPGLASVPGATDQDGVATGLWRPSVIVDDSSVFGEPSLDVLASSFDDGTGPGGSGVQGLTNGVAESVPEGWTLTVGSSVQAPSLERGGN
jgi:hypothetical protein